MLKQLFVCCFLVAFILCMGACKQATNCWDTYRPVYFSTKENSLTFSKYLKEKHIDVVTLEDIVLEVANFPLPAVKNWQEIECMAGEDPRYDDFMQTLPALFEAGSYSVIYVPRNVSSSQLKKHAYKLQMNIFFSPEEISFFKKDIYLFCFTVMGILWIFLRPSQAFFLIFALILGLVFIANCELSYYALIICFFAYASLLDNWAKHYQKVKYTGTPLIKTLRRTTLSWLIYGISYVASITICWQEQPIIFLINLYFILLFFSFLIWIYWVTNRQDKKTTSNFFPANIVNKNLTVYTPKGFLYIATLFISIAPFFFLMFSPSLPQAKQYIKANEALYPQINRTSLLILYRTPSDYPNLASYLAHRFYQQTLPFAYQQSFGFPPKEELIKQKTYSFEGIVFKEEKEKVLIALNDQWIDKEVEKLSEFWRILISREHKLLFYKLASEPFILFKKIEIRLICLCLFFFMIFSLKLKSYFRIIN